MVEQLGSNAGVFGGYDRSAGQDGRSARGQVAKIADRGGDDVKAGGKRRIRRERWRAAGLESVHMAILKRLGGRWQAPRPLALTAIALALVVNACAAPRQTAAPTVAPPPPRLVEAPKPLPLPEIQQNRVAMLVPLTGANAPVGQSIANAANMAMLDIGDKHINLRVYDTTQGAGAAAQKALADGAGLILGPLLAGDIKAVQAVAGSQHVPVLSFSNDSTLAGDDVYVLGFQLGQSIGRSIAYARSRGVDRFAALVPAGVYGQRAQSAFVRAVEAAGGRTTSVITYPRDPVKMAGAIRTITAFDSRTKAAPAVIRADGSVAQAQGGSGALPFQALLIADSGSVAAQMLPALDKYGAGTGRIVLIGTELWNNEPGLAKAVGLRGAIFASVPDERFVKLAERYKTKFGSNPSRLASFGYDSVLLVNSLASNWPLGAAFPSASLTNRDGFAGIDGAFRFSRDGIAERMLEVQQIGAAGIGVVSPAPRGFSN
jgi:hypothetical protein